VSRHSFEVAVCIDDECKPETVTAECSEDYPGSELIVVEVWRFKDGRIYDCFDELDHITRDSISERCNRIQERNAA